MGHPDETRTLREVVDDEFDAEHPASDSDGVFRIHDLESAEWAMRKVARIRRKQAEVREVATAAIARYEAWLAAENEHYDHQAQWFEEQLEHFHREQLMKDPNGRKSIPLPSGVLKSTQRPARWNFDDETFLAWARDHHPEFIRTTEVVDKAAVKKALALRVGGPTPLIVTGEGEVVPGVAIESSERVYKVEPDLGVDE